MRYLIEPRDMDNLEDMHFYLLLKSWVHMQLKLLKIQAMNIAKNFLIMLKDLQDNASDINMVTAMYKLIEYSNNYSKTSGSLWQYCKDIPAVNNNCNIVEFNGANATDSFNFKSKITGHTGDNGRIDNIEVTVPLKYLRNLWWNLEMPLINCEVKLILTWSENCFIIHNDVVNQNPIFEITEIKLYVPAVTL